MRGFTATTYVNKDPDSEPVERIKIPQKTSTEMIRASKNSGYEPIPQKTSLDYIRESSKKTENDPSIVESVKELASRADLIKDKVQEEKIPKGKPLQSIFDGTYINKEPPKDGEVEYTPQKTNMDYIRQSSKKKNRKRTRYNRINERIRIKI